MLTLILDIIMHMKKTKVITHRGLNPDVPGFPFESSKQAFEAFLKQGWGLEFDVQFTADGQMIATHDANLKRITGGKDERKLSDVQASEILALRFGDDNALTTVDEVFGMIARTQAEGALSALHLKSLWQSPKHVDVILKAIRESGVRPDQMIVFDVKIDTAQYIHSKMPELPLAASVSHPYDIERYNNAAGGTLISLEQLVASKHLFSWAWVDEWDRADQNEGDKTFCNAETFTALREHGIGIALVTPELHATSPMLPTGQSPHVDGLDRARLLARLREIASLRPDAMCTDHPDELQKICNELTA
jgi:glycerophosphoryl diester phosphodiesterase